MRVYPRKKREMTRADNDNNKVILVMSDARLFYVTGVVLQALLLA